MILSTMRELLFVEITEKLEILAHKHEKCRICMADKFGIHHGGDKISKSEPGMEAR